MSTSILKKVSNPAPPLQPETQPTADFTPLSIVLVTEKQLEHLLQPVNGKKSRIPSATQLPVLSRVWKQSKEIDSIAG